MSCYFGTILRFKFYSITVAVVIIRLGFVIRRFLLKENKHWKFKVARFYIFPRPMKAKLKGAAVFFGNLEKKN